MLFSPRGNDSLCRSVCACGLPVAGITGIKEKIAGAPKIRSAREIRCFRQHKAEFLMQNVTGELAEDKNMH